MEGRTGVEQGRASVLKSLPSFGRIDAETEKTLADFFLETPAYERIENRERIVVTGRKGAGKTAIYSILRDRARTRWTDFHIVGLDFRLYPWDLHDVASSTSSPSVERYANVWQFLILVEAAKLVIRSDPQVSGREGRRALRQLRRFVKRNWGGFDTGVGRTFLKASYTLEFEPKAFGFSLGSLTRQRVPRDQLATELAGVVKGLRSALETVLDRNASHLVMLDDLDGGFATDDHTARDRLLGLIVAAHDISIWVGMKDLPLTPVVFMRSDIYTQIEHSSRNKIDTGALERIAWSEGENGPASLKKLMEQRIGALLGYETEDPWGEIFADEQIDGQSLYRFMASRTHRRPRDMIHLANSCLECAKTADADRIGADHVLAALPVYSDYLLQEIADAAHQSVADWDECLMILRRLGTRSFERDAFDREHQARDTCDTADRALSSLYSFGVIGYRQGRGVVFSYHDDAKRDLSAELFEVHPGLWDALDLRATRESKGGDTDQDARRSV